MASEASGIYCKNVTLESNLCSHQVQHMAPEAAGTCQCRAIFKLTYHPWPAALAGLMAQECTPLERGSSVFLSSSGEPRWSHCRLRVQRDDRNHPSFVELGILAPVHMVQYHLSGNRELAQLPTTVRLCRCLERGLCERLLGRVGQKGLLMHFCRRYTSQPCF